MSFSWKENLPKELNDKVTKVEKNDPTSFRKN